jgi:hypothetical protein
MSNNNWSPVLVIAASAFAVAAGYFAGPLFVHAQTGGTWTPLTAEMTIADYAPNGTATVTRKVVFAIRSDGSRAELFVETNGVRDGKRKIALVGKRQQLMIDPATESITTYPLNDGALAHTIRKRSCVPQPGAESSSMLGHSVYRETREEDFKQSLLRWDEWLAPDLNCMALRSKNEGVMAAGGQVIGRQIVEVTSVKVGEPAEELFAVPPGLTERSPSEVFRESDRRRREEAAKKDAPGQEARRLPCASCDATTNQRLDRAYHAARQ